MKHNKNLQEREQYIYITS